MGGGRITRSLVLIGGGVRAGKSRFALELARRLGERRLFVATAIGFDAEMQERIAAHRSERGSEFETIEAPYALAPAVRAAGAAEVVVIDCLTLWLSNLLLQDPSPAKLRVALDELVAALRERTQHVIVVTNEVGMGVVPESALGRQFRDLAGNAHQRLAAEADRMYLAVLGTILRIKPEPIRIGRGNDVERD